MLINTNFNIEYTLRTLIQVILLSLLLMACSSNNPPQDYQQTHQGSILGYAYDEYKLQLHKGDSLTANINIQQLEVIIFAPTNLTLTNQKPVEIKSEGEYILRVLMPRALARRNKEYQYQLSLTVTRHQ